MICEQNYQQLGLPLAGSEVCHGQKKNGDHPAAMEGLTSHEKKCIHCKEVKPIAEFRVRKENGRRRTVCLKCESAQKIQWHYRNHSKVLSGQKEYRKIKLQDPEFVARQKASSAKSAKKCRAKIYARVAARRPLIIEKTRAYIRNWQRHKRQTDPQYNIGNRLRSRMWHAVASNKGKKAAKTMELVGCTVSELRVHLEKQFKDGMNWERFMAGDIHIDHIRPCASYDLTDPEQQKACFNFRNLQPLWALDNISKGAKLICPKIAVDRPYQAGKVTALKHEF